MANQKHFLVNWVTPPEQPTALIESVEIAAVFPKVVQVISWLQFQNDEDWLLG
jgi:hypothetical protein